MTDRAQQGPPPHAVSSQPHLLIVEDDSAIASLMAAIGSRLGCRCTTATTASAAIEVAQHDMPRLAVVDYQLGGEVSGLQLLDQLATLSPAPIVIFTTGYGSEEVAAEALKKGAFDYVIKEADSAARIEAALQRALAHVAAQDALARYRAELAEREMLFRRAHEEAPLPYHALDASGRIVRANAQWRTLFGYQDPDIVGTPLADLLTEPYRHAWEQWGTALLASFGYQEHEVELRAADGSVVPVRCYCRATPGSGNEPPLAHCILVDLRPERQAHAEAAARQREVLQIFETTQEGIWLCDTNHVTTLVNRRMAEMLGYEPDEMVGRSIYDFIVPEEHDDQRKRSRSRGRTHSDHFVRRLVARDGTVKPFEVSVTTSTAPDGTYTGSIAMFTDLSELTRRELEYRRLTRLFRGTADAVPDLLFVLDDDQNIRYANAATAARLKLPMDQIIGRRCCELVHDAADSPRWCPFRALNGTGATRTVRMHEPRLGGHFDVSVTPIEEAGTGERLYAHVARDVTELVRNEARALREAEWLREQVTLATMPFDSEKDLLSYALERCAALNGSPLGYLHLVEDGEVNLRLFIWTKATLETCTAPMDPHYPLAEAGIWADAVRLRRPVFHNDYQNIPDRKGYPEGHPHIVRHMSVPIVEGDAVVAVVGLGNKTDPYDDGDATEVASYFSLVWHMLQRLRAENELQALNEDLHRRVEERTAELRLVNQRLHEYVHAISHDLRNAITQVTANSEDLQRKDGPRLDEESQRWLGYFVTAAHKLADMEDALLRLSRETRGEVNRTNVDLSALAHHYRRLLRNYDPARPVEWHIEEGVVAYCDRGLADRVVDNLLGNAWKYSASRNPAVIEFGATERKGRRWLYVRDNGIGFAQEFAERAFVPFQRYHKTQGISGQGVGLSIVRRNVDQHLGGAEIESAEDRGTTVYFHFGDDTPREAG